MRKRLIKIYCVPSHDTPERTSGVDFARIIQPMSALDGFTTERSKFKVDIFSAKKDKGVQWYELAQKYDIFYLNYTAADWSYAAMACFGHKFGVKMAMDVDDALWHIMPDNSAYEAYKKGSDGIYKFTCIANDIPFITTTNDYLKNIILDKTYKTKDKVTVFPNYINLSLYNHRPAFRNENHIRLLHFGSTSHFIDLQTKSFEDAIDRLFKTYPNVSLKCIGAFIPQWKMRWGMRIESGYGDSDIYRWIKNKYPSVMDEADIMVVPLAENPYTRSKSHIKWLEMSAAKKPGVWQNIRQYAEVIDPGKTGLLAMNASEWFESIKRLIDDVDLRQKMGEAAFNEVEKHWQMKDHVIDYARYFEYLLDKDSAKVI